MCRVGKLSGLCKQEPELRGNSFSRSPPRILWCLHDLGNLEQLYLGIWMSSPITGNVHNVHVQLCFNSVSVLKKIKVN